MDYGDLQLIALARVRVLVAEGRFTLPELKQIRHRLLWDSFPACAERDLLLVEVNDRIAVHLGCPADHIPGSPLLVEDCPPGVA